MAARWPQTRVGGPTCHPSLRPLEVSLGRPDPPTPHGEVGTFGLLDPQSGPNGPLPPPLQGPRRGRSSTRSTAASRRSSRRSSRARVARPSPKVSASPAGQSRRGGASPEPEPLLQAPGRQLLFPSPRWAAHGWSTAQLRVLATVSHCPSRCWGPRGEFCGLAGGSTQ